MKVAVVMGSINDLSIVEKVFPVLKRFQVEYEARVISAHRSPQAAADFAVAAQERGIKVIIAAAGKAAHLAGVLAGHTTLPVIGLPIKSSTMDGMDSLLSTVQMPDGVPVATVAINGAFNAALLAVQMLALSSTKLQESLLEYKREMLQNICTQDADLQAALAKTNSEEQA